MFQDQHGHVVCQGMGAGVLTLASEDSECCSSVPVNELARNTSG